ncbi:MAG: hypothetical protein V4629_07940 [Pseudomonadota bacterium]
MMVSSSSFAEFIISSAILEFNANSEPQQDIELISRSNTNDYIVTEISEILNPESNRETRRIIDDPQKSRLLVTPQKTVLGARSRKVLRFVLLKKLDHREYIYRVVVKPVIKGVENTTQIGLKVLVGYEVLVIIRPEKVISQYTAKRTGNKLTITNVGNTNLLFQDGKQCITSNNCKTLTALRVYPEQTVTADLPLDKSVQYSLWNGTEIKELQVE